MNRTKRNARGFTLIASLLLLALMSCMAIALFMMVTTEGKAGGGDLQNTLAFRNAEGGIEHMTADLANTLESIQNPKVSDITSLSADNPSPTTWVQYSLTPATKNNDGVTPLTSFQLITSGTFAGLYAQTWNVNLLSTAQTVLNDQVSMTRQVQIALIPVFQFGAFSQVDLSYFPGPNMDFQGRVHTNGDLYLAAGGTVTFHDKVSAYGNVIREQLANGQLTNVSHNGVVDVLTASGGCDGAKPACRALALTEGSVVGAANSAYNGGPPSWATISKSSYNGWLVDGNYGNPTNTGVQPLNLPFIGGGANIGQYEIIRRPPNAGSSIDSSRLYTQSEIRILISDDPAELPGGAADSGNIRLANYDNSGVGGPNYSNCVPATPKAGLPVLASGGTYNTCFAQGSTAVPDTYVWTATAQSAAYQLPADWTHAPSTANLLLQPVGTAPLLGAQGAANPPAPFTMPPCTITGGGAGYTCAAVTYPYYTPTPAATTSNWNLIDGYIRVDVEVGGAWVNVTQNWLEQGFSRGTTPPTAPGTNPINPNAILIFQQPADRNADGALDTTGTAPTCVKSGGTYSLAHCTYGKPPEAIPDASTNLWDYGDSKSATSNSRNNWYPINFYDQREGEIRDNVAQAAASCSTNGVMNAVELDVGNLNNWLQTDAIGKTVDNVTYNGYILYFSDRRGMRPAVNIISTHPVGEKSGDSQLEDSVNAMVGAAGTPDQRLDTDYMPGKPAVPTSSPEDANGNGLPDIGGAIDLANGFWNPGSPATTKPSTAINTSVPLDPYTNRINSCVTTGRRNFVAGARHVLRLVDGSLGNLPTAAGGTGGFTVASENPVYVWGNYNSNAGDTTWNSPSVDVAHSAASIIADAVTVLSNQWSDLTDMLNPVNSGARAATAPAYYRMGVCAGKNPTFPTAQYAWATGDFGSDGGVHNFLRLLESWGTTLNYKGSMANLYYATYATGADKTNPYGAPTRNFIFDSDFTNPAGLPPGTPMFRDIDNLSYRQMLTQRTNAD